MSPITITVLLGMTSTWATLPIRPVFVREDLPRDPYSQFPVRCNGHAVRVDDSTRALEGRRARYEIWCSIPDVSTDRASLVGNCTRFSEAIDGFTLPIALETEKLRQAQAEKGDLDAIQTRLAMLHYNRGLARERKGNRDDARQDFARAAALDPRLADIAEREGEDSLNMQKYDRSIVCYSTAIRLRPDMGRFYQNRGIAYFWIGRYLEAHEDFQRHVALDPDSVDANVCLSWFYATCPGETLRNGKKALALAQTAVKLEQRGGIFNGNTYDAIAGAHAELGAFDLAIKYQMWSLTDKGFSDSDEGANARRRLDLYKQGRPFRESVRKGKK